MRIYITGASCAGVTTLGHNLVTQLGVRHVDVDDFYWMPTNPPFTTKRPVSERVSLIQQKLGDDGWVMTGSCIGWGDALITHADLIVFVVTATPVRLERLAAREEERFGNRIAPYDWRGGWRTDKHSAASPHRTPRQLAPARFQYRRACPWARWRARWCRCESSQQVSQKSGTCRCIFCRPTHHDFAF